jgi:hypothetical protein
MRSLVAVCLACGCSATPAAPSDAADAPVCGAVRAIEVPAGCVAGGLGAIDVNGTWTFTGTFVDYDGFRRDFTTPAMLDRTGTGYCAFGLSYSLALDSGRSFTFSNVAQLSTYVDDNVAMADANLLCAVDATSLSLTYVTSMVVGEGRQFRTITGTLTR